MTSSALIVGGLARLSTCDWPGELVATVFCQGCGWDCHYCHNPHLIPAHGEDEIPWTDIQAFLEGRRGLLDGVAFSGGEPLLQAALHDAIDEVREMGFRVALHTNGQLPERFSAVLPLVDWVGLDVKAAKPGYERVTRVAGSGERAWRTLDLLVASGLPYEVRTTVHSSLLSESDVEELAADLRAAGVARWVVQAYRPEGVRPGALPASRSLSDALLGRLSEGFGEFEFRG